MVGLQAHIAGLSTPRGIRTAAQNEEDEPARRSEQGGRPIMMYGYGFGWGWLMWFGGVLIIMILAALIVLIVRTFTTGAPERTRHQPSTQVSSARQIAEERLARGELTPDEFREIVKALEQPK
jgi:putative membrane protein